MGSQGSNNFLFGYGGASIDNPKYFIYVPERMTTAQFMGIIGNSFLDFIRSVQDGGEAAGEGRLEEVDKHIETLVNLNKEYEDRNLGLRGLEGHNQFLMLTAIKNHLEKENPNIDEVKKYVSKYKIPLKI